MTETSDLRTYADILRRIRELTRKVTAMEEEMRSEVESLRSSVSDIRKNDYELRESLNRLFKEHENRIVTKILGPLSEMTRNIEALTQPRFGRPR